eukprot:COSAG02_NODE_8834_length_2426_cov_7.902970_2_plen_83_part_00
MVHVGTYAQARSINAAAFRSQVLEGNETLYGFDLFEDDEVITGRSAIMGISYPDCAYTCQLISIYMSRHSSCLSCRDGSRTL